MSAVESDKNAMAQTSTTARKSDLAPSSHTSKEQGATFWRVEGSLLNLGAVRPVAFFTWNAQSFSERWMRRGGVALLALIRPLLYGVDRIFATRALHMLLRGVSRDRLDLLGEEYFNYVLKPQLKPNGVAKLKEAQARGAHIALVSQGLDHVMRPLAQYLGVERLIANRLEFRDGLATGRLLSPVIRPRQALARIIGGKADGRVTPKRLARNLGFSNHKEMLDNAVIPAKRQFSALSAPTVIFEPRKKIERLSVRETIAGKRILLIGFTGFIGKVWLAKILEEIPEVAKVYLLIRRQRSTTARRRFEKIVAESPLFENLHARHGENFGAFLAEKTEVIEGDITQPGLGIEAATFERLKSGLDLVINSSGLTDFNPDLRQALSINIDGTLHVIDFLRRCDHAALLHLSTCYVVGYRDGRITETLTPNYTPKGIAGFDAEAEYESLRNLAREIEARAESAPVTEQLRQQVLSKGRKLSDAEIEAQVRKQRQRWTRDKLIEAGMD
ncbi:MAG TPA: SDR family oxidoreductase, partial [Blastocatellia bacterium]